MDLPRKLGGHLQTVLETLRTIRASGVWLEVTTLIVPDINDSDNELSAIATDIDTLYTYEAIAGGGSPQTVLRAGFQRRPDIRRRAGFIR